MISKSALYDYFILLLIFHDFFFLLFLILVCLPLFIAFFIFCLVFFKCFLCFWFFTLTLTWCHDVYEVSFCCFFNQFFIFFVSILVALLAL